MSAAAMMSSRSGGESDGAVHLHPPRRLVAGRRADAAPDWRLTGILYWQGVCFRRGSHAHQRLMRRAWAALSSTPQFAGTLEATGNAALDSPISDDPEQTLPLVLAIVQTALTLTLILSGAPLALLPLPATIFCAWMLWRRLRRRRASE